MTRTSSSRVSRRKEQIDTQSVGTQALAGDEAERDEENPRLVLAKVLDSLVASLRVGDDTARQLLTSLDDHSQVPWYDPAYVSLSLSLSFESRGRRTASCVAG